MALFAKRVLVMGAAALLSGGLMACAKAEKDAAPPEGRPSEAPVAPTVQKSEGSAASSAASGDVSAAAPRVADEPRALPPGVHEETVIVREYQLNRDMSATLVVDRVDYNQKGMTFEVTPEDDKLQTFLKANMNVPLIVRYEDEPVPFFVTAARRK